MAYSSSCRGSSSKICLGGSLRPAPNHVEFYYGFYGAALAWQIVYFMISRDPARYRPLMLVGVLAKLSFFGTCVTLFLIGRLEPGGVLYGSLLDAVFMVLFLIAYSRMPRQSVFTAVTAAPTTAQPQARP